MMNVLANSGRALITDTKLPKQAKTQTIKAPPSTLPKPVDNDPHKVLIKRCIDERISKKEIVEEFKKMIERAEAEL